MKINDNKVGTTFEKTCDKNCSKCKFYLKIYDGYFESYRCVQNIEDDLNLIKNRHENF